LDNQFRFFKALLLILSVTFIAIAENAAEPQLSIDTTLNVSQNATLTASSVDSLRKFNRDSLQAEYDDYVRMEKEGIKIRVKGGIILGLVAPLTLVASATVLALIDSKSDGKLLENAGFVIMVPAFGVVGVGAGGCSLRMKGKRMVKKARYFKHQIEIQLSDLDSNSSQ
jgi:hypothetical protein